MDIFFTPCDQYAREHHIEKDKLKLEGAIPLPNEKGLAVGGEN